MSLPSANKLSLLYVILLLRRKGCDRHSVDTGNRNLVGTQIIGTRHTIENPGNFYPGMMTLLSGNNRRKSGKSAWFEGGRIGEGGIESRRKNKVRSLGEGVSKNGASFHPGISIMEIALVPASSSREKYLEYTSTRRTIKSSQFGRRLDTDDEA